MEERPRDGLEQFPLLPGQPDDFRPEQIIYRELIQPNRGQYRYREIDRPTPFNASVSLEGFFRGIARRGYFPNVLDVPEDHALDMGVSRDSYIAIRLADGSGLTFAPDVDAVALTRRSVFYGALRYVDLDDDGRIYDHWIRDCRLVFFSANFRRGYTANPYQQGFFFNFTEYRGFVPLDPDVRHPGNGTS